MVLVLFHSPPSVQLWSVVIQTRSCFLSFTHYHYTVLHMNITYVCADYDLR